MPRGRVRVTVNQRILVHLLHYLRAEDRMEAPPQITQQGIADVLGVRRSHVTMALHVLAERGLVEDRVMRVAGGARRRKAYALTPFGFARANEARARIESLGTNRPAAGPDASAALSRPRALPDA